MANKIEPIFLLRFRKIFRLFLPNSFLTLELKNTINSISKLFNNLIFTK